MLSLCDLGASVSTIPKTLCDLLGFRDFDDCKERTARMCAKKDCFVKACSSSFHDNKDEDLKVIDVSLLNLYFAIQILIIMGLEMSQLYLEGVPIIRSF